MTETPHSVERRLRDALEQIRDDCLGDRAADPDIAWQRATRHIANQKAKARAALSKPEPSAGEAAISQPATSREAVAIPDGHALVPIEPTAGMIRNAWRVIPQNAGVQAREVWSAMLAATAALGQAPGGEA